MARKIVAEFDAVDGPFLRKLSNIDAGIARFEKGALSGFGRVEKGISGLMASAGRLQMIGGAIGAGFGAQMATQFLDGATRIRNALRSIGAESDENFNLLYLASTRSLVGMEAFSAAVQRMHKALSDRQSFEDTVRQVETLNKLMAVGGKSASERAAATLQFAQALQSGKLQGDEFRSLRENAPIELLQAFADELGTTRGELQKFASAGEITADVMVAALTKLEAEADARMKGVVLTFADAATAMANGALVAAEGFDKGLGLSRAGTAALTALGTVLGENAEAFEVFGKAAQIAFAFLGAAYLGRRVQDANAAMARFYAAQTTGVQAAAASAIRVQAAEAVIVAAKQKTVLGIKAKITALAAEGAAQTKVDAAMKRLAAAETGLAFARTRFTQATLAAAAAQERLAFSSRAVLAAGNMMRGAFAFIGGWPGLILLAGTALLTFGGNAETATEKLDRMRAVTDEAAQASDELAQAQERLNTLLADSGKAATEAGKKIIAATREEIKNKRELLRIENARAKETEAQRQIDIRRAQADMAALRIEVQTPTGDAMGVGIVDETAVADANARAQAEYMAKMEAARERILLLQQDSLAAQRTIYANEVLLGEVIQGHAERAEARAAVEKVMTEEVRTRANAYAEELATLTQEATIAALIKEYGKDSAIVAGQRLAFERETYAAALITKGYTEDQRDALMDAWDAANGVAEAQIAANIAAGIAPAITLAAKLWDAAKAWNAARAYSMAPADPNTGPAFERGGRMGNTSAPYVEPPKTLDQLLADNAGSDGGGGGGGTRTDADMQKALQFVESMLTTEERRAKEMAELVALRTKLVATYGPEAEIVGRLDEAILRAQANMDGLTDQTNEFWGTLSDHIAGSINEWKGWGNFVRGVLSSLVQKWGPDFFQALFMPGKQTGGGFGQVLGNALTGQSKGAAAAKIAPMAKAAPMARAAGLMAKAGPLDRMTGRLNDRISGAVDMSAVSLKMPAAKPTAGGADTYNFNTNNDFRGVDLSTRREIEAKIDRANAALPGRVIKTIQDAKRARVKI